LAGQRCGEDCTFAKGGREKRREEEKWRAPFLKKKLGMVM
jgi:hypothetical protein